MKNFKRTVILVDRRTNPGQDLFIRGGIDHGHFPSCVGASSAYTSPCAIPLFHRKLEINTVTPARDSWAVADMYLDWEGPEPTQGKYNGRVADGTPAQWTTNQIGAKYYSPLNTFGPQYWYVDVNMDCSKTVDGFFEFKALVNGNWEGNPHLEATCGGPEGKTPPYHSPNHFARCGYLNVFHWDTPGCDIYAIPSAAAAQQPIVG
ncbi:alpha-amylase [Aplysia californica]|uniref:Alpha-amylase n=1 Tax=Aplysia californica TaxID=6500 RepID=A0ABM0ZX66_APLCA|nr:alpha-amylase [Aplysia californica]